MVVFVVFNGFKQTFSIKPLLSLKCSNNFLIQQIRSLHNSKLLALYRDDLLLVLQSRWHDLKTGTLRLVEFVPVMLANLINRDSLVWVCVENSIDHVFSFS